jgi:hypothetical protein
MSEGMVKRLLCHIEEVERKKRLEAEQMQRLRERQQRENESRRRAAP